MHHFDKVMLIAFGAFAATGILLGAYLTFEQDIHHGCPEETQEVDQ